MIKSRRPRAPHPEMAEVICIDLSVRVTVSFAPPYWHVDALRLGKYGRAWATIAEGQDLQALRKEWQRLTGDRLPPDDAGLERLIGRYFPQ